MVFAERRQWATRGAAAALVYRLPARRPALRRRRQARRRSAVLPPAAHGLRRRPLRRRLQRAPWRCVSVASTERPVGLAPPLIPTVPPAPRKGLSSARPWRSARLVVDQWWRLLEREKVAGDPQDNLCYLALQAESAGGGRRPQRADECSGVMQTSMAQHRSLRHTGTLLMSSALETLWHSIAESQHAHRAEAGHRCRLDQSGQHAWQPPL